MQMMSVDKLIPHRKNTYFFDDIKDEPWFAFIDSIQTSGVIEPIIATQDNVIVSGHQRVRACKELGIKEVAVEVRHYDSEDEILKQLIETNICQRGIGNVNAVKMGRCLKELERIEGVRHGGDRKSSGNNFPLAKTQAALAEEIGITPKQWRNYKSLTDMVPELQDAVQTGTITATTAYGLVKKLSPDEQKQLAEKLSGFDKKRSFSEVNAMIDEVKAENDKLRRLLSEKEVAHKKQVSDLEKIISERPVITKTVEKEVYPDDYESALKREQNLPSDYHRLQKEMAEAKERVRQLEEQNGMNDSQNNLERDARYFSVMVTDFISKAGGYIWITDRINDLPENQRKRFKEDVKNIGAWAQQMMNNMG